MFNAVICRYHEIATKGGNRMFFENCLMDNIRFHLKNESAGDFAVRRVRGRIWVERRDGGDFGAELESVERVLSRTYGLQSFSPVVKVRADMAAVREAAAAMCRERFAQQSRGGFTFRVRARRSDKNFPLCSRDIEIELVTLAAENAGEKSFVINLDNAEITLGCEIREEFAVLFWGELPGPGGLPVGSNPGVLCLLSGGIDSPVAVSMLQKRGCPVDYITFHSSPYTPPETVEKVRRLAKILNTYQRSGRLFLCNLAEIQKQIRDLCSERLRTVLYRRAMFRIAEKVAEYAGDKALVTGEAVGQVASQTIPNLITINAASRMLILRPVIGMDKSEAIIRAEKLGTFEISKEQVPDSCTVFAPSSPATSVPEKVAAAEELRIPDYDGLIEKIAAETIAAMERP